jgi:hypothetical protein
MEAVGSCTTLAQRRRVRRSLHYSLAVVCQQLGKSKRQDKEVSPMAINKPYGDNRRIGAVRQRSQVQMPSGNWVKRDDRTGRFMDVKSNGKPFKGVRRER